MIIKQHEYFINYRYVGDISLVNMVAAEMIKMATGDDSPLRHGAGKGLDWFSVATEPCGGGTSDLGSPR